MFLFIIDLHESSAGFFYLRNKNKQEFKHKTHTIILLLVPFHFAFHSFLGSDILPHLFNCLGKWKKKIASDYDYFSVSIIWGRSVRLTETLVIMLPSIGVLLQKQVSPKMFNHAAINVSQLKTNLVRKGASWISYMLFMAKPSLKKKRKKKRLGFCVPK